MSSIEDEEVAKECEEFTTNIPVVGKTYHVFDNGKVKLSRHYLVKCTKVIPFAEFSTDEKWERRYQIWKDALSDEDDLPENVKTYSKFTNYIIECSLVSPIVEGEDEEDMKEYFTLDVDGRWFGFGDWISNGLLDVMRKYWDSFYEEAHDPRYCGYTPEAMEEIERLNNI